MLGTKYERDYACTALELTEPPYQQTTAQGFGTCMLHVATPAVGFCAHSTAAGRATAWNERCITSIMNQWCMTSNQPMQNAECTPAIPRLLMQLYVCQPVMRMRGSRLHGLSGAAIGAATTSRVSCGACDGTGRGGVARWAPPHSSHAPHASTAAPATRCVTRGPRRARA